MDSIKNSVFLEKLKERMPILYQRWKILGQDTGYPIDYQGVTSKSEPLLLELDGFINKNVLDIGCNSGLYSYFCGQYANSIIGCELEELLLKRADSARLFFNSFYDTSHVSFFHGNFVDKLSSDITGIIAACVLYHVGDDNLKALMKFLVTNRPMIMLQARPMRYDAFLANPEWGMVSNTKLFNGMFRIEDNLNFLKECGYNNARVIGLRSTLFYGEYFPVIIASN